MTQNMSDVENNDLESLLVQQQKIAQSAQNQAFEIVDVNYDPKKEAEEKAEKMFRDNLETYCTKAKSSGVPDDIVESARDRATRDNCNSYADFAKLVEEEFDKSEDGSNSDEDTSIDEMLLKKSVDKEISTRLSKIDDLSQHLANLIYTQYNTTAAGVADLLYQAENNPAYEDDIRLDIYHTPMYSLILQYDKPWVEDIVYLVRDNWEDNPTVMDIVNEYIDSLGGPKEDGNYESEYQTLLQYLPDNLRNENSPLMYKAFRAVLLIRREKDDPYEQEEFTEKLLSNAEATDDYLAELDLSMDDGIPYEASNINATEAAAETLNEEKFNLSNKVGKCVGWCMNVKYNTAKSFEDGMRDAIGDERYAEYLEHREDVKAEKELKHQERQQRREERRRQQEIDDAVEAERLEEEREIRREEREIKRQEREQQRQQQMYNQQQCNQQQQMYNQQQGYYQQQPKQGFFGSRRQPNQYGNQYGYNNQYGNQYNYGYNNQKPYINNGNFAPNVPIWLLSILVNAIVGLLIWLLFGKTSAIFSAIGLVVAVLGFIKQKHNEPNAIVTVIAGYAIVALSIILALWK